MHQPDSHARYLDQMRLAHPLIILIEPMPMPIEALVAIAERRDHRRDRRQLVEHAIHVNVARMHHEIDPREHLEHLRGKMLAGFGNMSVRDQADSHHDLHWARMPAEREP